MFSADYYKYICRCFHFVSINQNSYEHSHKIKIIYTCICNTFVFSVLKELVLKCTQGRSNWEFISVLRSLNMIKRNVFTVNVSIMLGDCGVGRYCNTI